jgi:DNA-binding CsgD family transcriptional regulator
MRALRDYCDDLTRCTSMEAVGEVFRRGILEQGYTASLCPIITSASDRPHVRWMFRNLPPRWAAFSDQQKLPTRSPALLGARERLKPFTFVQICEHQPAEQRAIWAAIREWGWQNGFVVPVHGPAGYFSYVSIASPERDLDLSPANRADIQVFALLSHDRCHALSDPGERRDPCEALSARELECLRWVAAGKTDWEIGAILSIAATTAKFHVDSARRKLGAANRPHAVAMLALRGLL